MNVAGDCRPHEVRELIHERRRTDNEQAREPVSSTSNAAITVGDATPEVRALREDSRLSADRLPWRHAVRVECTGQLIGRDGETDAAISEVLNRVARAEKTAATLEVLDVTHVEREPHARLGRSGLCDAAISHEKPDPVVHFWGALI